MPTNQNAYNSRVTDEALEKRFRDTFTSQGGAELVSDLYASGVIVPVVDFTATAEGSSLRSDLQSAWDFSTGHATLAGNGSTTVVSNSGFWAFQWNITGVTSNSNLRLRITDGLTNKDIIVADQYSGNTAQNEMRFNGVVFLRSGDSLVMNAGNAANSEQNITYRQIATLSGDLVNPFGFTSS